MKDLNTKIFKFFNSIQNPFFNFFSELISSTIFLIIFFFFILAYYYFLNPLIIIICIISLFTNFCLNLFLKEIYYKKRPYLKNFSIKSLGTKNNDSSFPSNHVSFAGAICFPIVFMFSNYWLLLFLILISLSRMYNGKHDFIDVLSSFIFSFLISYSIVLVFHFINFT